MKTKKRLSSAKIKDLLKDLAEDIRARLVDNDEECEVVLNVAAVVEHMDPDTVR